MHLFDEYRVLRLYEDETERLKGIIAERIAFLLERERNEPMRRRVANALIGLGLAVDPTLAVAPDQPRSIRHFRAAR